METWLPILGALALWFILQAWVFPRFGVVT